MIRPITIFFADIKGDEYIISLSIEIKEVDNRWEAKCKELGVAAFSSQSKKDAEEKIREMTLLYLKTLNKENELEDFLSRNNILFSRNYAPKVDK